jgi:hypothetical protein
MSTRSILSKMSRGGRRETLGKNREKYKYPLSSNGHLSAAMPLSRCGTAAPSKTTKVKELLSWLSWLRCEDVLCKD